MTQKSNRYWNNRHKQWLGNQAKMDGATTKKLEKEYVRTASELEKEIASYFQRYGQDNVIEFRTMMQGLDKVDRDMLFKDMEAFAEKHPEHAHLMPVRESVYKLNRLQGLHYSTQMKLLELGAIEQKELEKHLEQTYGKRYEQVMKELGIGNQFLAIDNQTMLNTIFSKWVNGENFSDRIWGNKNNLLNHLTTSYRDGLARGDNYETLTKKIMDRFNVAYNDARRLVWTEATFVYNQSHTQAYKQAGVEEYEISAIMDHKTSRICRDMDGEKFKFEDMQVGVNFPPFHPYCRSTFIGVMDGLLDDDKGGIIKPTNKEARFTGALNDFKKQQEHAERYYEFIRKRKDDVTKIAHNTGWKDDAIQEIKDHVFVKEHMLQGKMQRFHPDYDQAQAWQRLAEGKNIKDSDLVFLKHEYVELTQMRLHGYDYEKAHKIANNYHNWQKVIDGRG